ncbi:hypothetical protein [Streptomyces sp. NPDC054946]
MELAGGGVRAEGDMDEVGVKSVTRKRFGCMRLFEYTFEPDKGRLWCANTSSETRDLVRGRPPKN